MISARKSRQLVLSHIAREHVQDGPIAAPNCIQVLNAYIHIRNHMHSASLKSCSGPRASTGAFPLSFSQLALWLLEHLCTTEGAYTIPLAYRVTGPLDIKALERSLLELVNRHEILRTRFEVTEGSPAQVVESARAFEFQQHYVGGCSPQDKKFEAYRLLLQEVHRGFDLSRGHLFRACVVPLSADDHLFLITMHHLLSDAWSLRNMLKELRPLYEAYASDQASPLPPLPIQYSDYARWQHEWSQGAEARKQLRYWSETLSDLPPELALPTNRARPNPQSFKGSRVPIPITEEMRLQILDFCRRQNVTLHLMMVAVFQLLITQCTDQWDFVIGVPVAGRVPRETRKLMGYFVNTVVLRLSASPDESFLEILNRVRRVTTEAYSNQDVPFPMVYSELGLDRDLSRNPVYQVMLSTRHAYEEQAELPGLRVQWLGDWAIGSKVDLTLLVLETRSGLQARIEYCSDLFDRETISAMACAFQTTISAAVSDPHRSIAVLKAVGSDWCARDTSQEPQADLRWARTHDSATAVR